MKKSNSPPRPGRSHWRRSGRSGGGVHPGRARLQCCPFRDQPLARGQGRGPRSRRLPLRHGPDNPHSAFGPGAHLRRGRPQTRRLRGRSSDSTRNGARSLPTVRPSTCGPMSARCSTISMFLRPGTGAGYRRFMEQSARLHRVSDRFFFWRPVGGLRDTFDGEHRPGCVAAVRPSCLAARESVAATVRSHVPELAVAADARSFHAVCGLGS